jgi:hypothetical protein
MPFEQRRRTQDRRTKLGEEDEGQEQCHLALPPNLDELLQDFFIDSWRMSSRMRY